MLDWKHETGASAISGEALDEAIARATKALRAAQRADGHWAYPLEADATIPSEYVLLTRFLGETPDVELERKIATYLRRRQGADGGWPLYYGGALDISATVKAYFCLKMIGDDPRAAHMIRARDAILAHGGAERVNVFTRILLAMFDVIPWSATPRMPVEIMLLPRWSPFHLTKISYWARTVIVPLLVIQTLRPKSRAGRIELDEIFRGPPREIGPLQRAPHQNRAWFAFFAGVDRVLGVVEAAMPKRVRTRAVQRAVDFATERLNGEDGLGAIFPAMANVVVMFDALGRGPNDPLRAEARRAVDKLLLDEGDEAYCQPCVSPVWDTALACHALLETGDADDIDAARRGLDWLLPRQELEVRGDWSAVRPDVRPGGWAFQYNNAHYPDLDDTAVIAMAMDRARREVGAAHFDEAIGRACEWIQGLQSRDGGWGAFDADNTHHRLDNIPFSDHGALLDPPSPDLTARCVALLSQTGAEPRDVTARGVEQLRRTQRADGSWYGRWGINYIYGTWSALCALAAAGVSADAPEVRRAIDWLVAIQNPDGGWGEDPSSYALDYEGHTPAPSTASQTAWALLGLMAFDAARPAVERGIGYLLRTQETAGLWTEHEYTGAGFPRVFYLRYHGYPKYFPLFALARHRTLSRGGAPRFGL